VTSFLASTVCPCSGAETHALSEACLAALKEAFHMIGRGAVLEGIHSGTVCVCALISLHVRLTDDVILAL
jgi:hypothetical protein